MNIGVTELRGSGLLTRLRSATGETRWKRRDNGRSGPDRGSIAHDLRTLGLERGETVLVHGSLSELGWVCGGAPAVVDALQRVVTESGTVVMPTHSPGNRDPDNMGNPPVPDSWADTIREQFPPYRPAVTPTQGMGAIAECCRTIR